MKAEVIAILLVEDNPDHAELAIKALARAKLVNKVFWVKDGEECLHFLFHEGIYADGANAPKPGLILLDIRLPKVDGLEVLRRIKKDPNLQSIPVVMLTTSDLGDEIKEAYQLGANSYVTKPVRFTEFVEKVQAVELYWLLTNVPPRD
ncbi:MAG: response regulator [Candidatus Binatia bacterium]